MKIGRTCLVVYQLPFHSRWNVKLLRHSAELSWPPGAGPDRLDDLSFGAAATQQLLLRMRGEAYRLHGVGSASDVSLPATMSRVRYSYRSACRAKSSCAGSRFGGNNKIGSSAPAACQRASRACVSSGVPYTVSSSSRASASGGTTAEPRAGFGGR